MKKNWKAIAGVVLVFVLGALSGALVSHRVCMHRMENFERGGPQMVDSIVRHLSHKLDLDQAQREEFRKIVTGTQTEMHAVRQTVKPQLEAILDKAHEKVRAILRPDQRERFEKFVAEHKERWKQREQ